METLPDAVLGLIIAEVEAMLPCMGLALRLVCRRWARIPTAQHIWYASGPWEEPYFCCAAGDGSLPLLMFYHGFAARSEPEMLAALNAAAQSGNLDCLRYLRPADAHVRQLSAVELTLAAAAASGSLDCLCEVIGWARSLDDIHFLGAFCVAAGTGAENCLVYLRSQLEMSSRAGSLLRYSSIAMDAAAAKGRLNCLKLLYSWLVEIEDALPPAVGNRLGNRLGSVMCASLRAARADQVEALQLLCVWFDQMNCTNRTSMGPTVDAAVCGNALRCLEFLRGWLEGLDLDVSGPLARAVHRRRAAVVQELLEWPSVNVTPAVHAAVLSRDVGTLRLLRPHWYASPQEVRDAMIGAGPSGAPACLVQLREWSPPLDSEFLGRVVLSTCGARLVVRLDDTPPLLARDRPECLRLLKAWGADVPGVLPEALRQAASTGRVDCLRVLRTWGAGSPRFLAAVPAACAATFEDHRLAALVLLLSWRRWTTAQLTRFLERARRQEWLAAVGLLTRRMQAERRKKRTAR